MKFCGTKNAYILITKNLLFVTFDYDFTIPNMYRSALFDRNIFTYRSTAYDY